MVVKPFSQLKTPQLYFGAGTFEKALSHPLTGESKSIVLVTGPGWFRKSSQYIKGLETFRQRGIQVKEIIVTGEPSPQLVDEAVEACSSVNPSMVMAVGGGSVLDAGKAISAMLPLKTSVLNYLEGVGKEKHPGTKVPFLAVPTTSGTGSEATSNAVLSQVGPQGFKKSLRHDNLVPDLAVLDPELMLSCPKAVTSASGLDALTQLLEGYVSTKATPFTDALALSGLEAVGRNLIAACTGSSDHVEVRGAMAYGAYLSGIVLSSAGLGLVHGYASPVGGYFKIPHGVVCGTLQGEAVKETVRHLRLAGDQGTLGLNKYAKAAEAITGHAFNNVDEACDQLVETLESWIEELEIPRLGVYGVQELDLDKIAASTGNKNNPIALDQETILSILKKRL